MITVQTRDSSGAQQASGPYGNETSDIVLHSAGGRSKGGFCAWWDFFHNLPHQTLVLPPDSFLIEMQINLSGWLHFP